MSSYEVNWTLMEVNTQILVYLYIREIISELRKVTVRLKKKSKINCTFVFVHFNSSMICYYSYEKVHIYYYYCDGVSNSISNTYEADEVLNTNSLTQTVMKGPHGPPMI
jgi:hypothetical protein